MVEGGASLRMQLLLFWHRAEHECEGKSKAEKTCSLVLQYMLLGNSPKDTKNVSFPSFFNPPNPGKEGRDKNCTMETS